MLLWSRFGLNGVSYMLCFESIATPNHKFHLKCGDLALESVWSLISAGLEPTWYWLGIGFGFARACPFSIMPKF